MMTLAAIVAGFILDLLLVTRTGCRIDLLNW